MNDVAFGMKSHKPVQQYHHVTAHLSHLFRVNPALGSQHDEDSVPFMEVRCSSSVQDDSSGCNDNLSAHAKSAVRNGFSALFLSSDSISNLELMSYPRPERAVRHRFDGAESIRAHHRDKESKHGKLCRPRFRSLSVTQRFFRPSSPLPECVTSNKYSDEECGNY